MFSVVDAGFPRLGAPRPKEIQIKTEISTLGFPWLRNLTLQTQIKELEDIPKI